MTREDFTAALEMELQLAGVSFTRADVQDFVAGAWPLIREQPDVAFWARQFIEAHPGGAGMMA
jgi:hypothetical protein